MTKVNVIYGAPCSGKTYFVKNNADPNDLIFDYDLLRTTISNEPVHSFETSSHHGTLIALREFLISRNADKIHVTTLWPSEQLCEILPNDTEFIRMDASLEKCLENLDNDDSRENKTRWSEIIRDWFAEHGDDDRFERSVYMKDDVIRLRTGDDENRRYFMTCSGDFKTRDDGGNPIIEGYFAVFNTTTELWPGAVESIAPSAFDNSISGDVRALINHDTTLVIGRTTNSTLELKTDSRGLWGRVKINPKDSDAMNIHARVERGDVTQCSFGFYPKSEETELLDDGSIHWTLTDVELFEVSCCTFPAYKETSIQARKRDAAAISERKADAWKLKMKKRFEHSDKEEQNNGNSNNSASKEDQ